MQAMICGGQHATTKECDAMLCSDTNIGFLRETKADFGASIRAAVRGFWAGHTNEFDFFDSMMVSIRRNLTKAWQEGAAEVGIRADELTSEELRGLENMIAGQFPHIGGFADAIEAGSKANGGLLRPQVARGRMWIARWDEAKMKGRMMAAGDIKQVWVLGPTLAHCGTCLKMSGKVKRSSTWLAHGILPKSPILRCGGFNCKCSLDPTDLPMSKGRLPGA